VPSENAIYEEAERNPVFGEGLARARKLGAQALAESVQDLAEDAVETLDPARTQLLINQCKLRIWLAGKYDERFADKPSTAVNIDMTMGKVLAETLAVEPPTVEHQAPSDGPSGKVEQKE
jgi:hypothetical protein